jgi:hypothetical protein
MRKNAQSRKRWLTFLAAALALLALIACGKSHDETGVASRSANEPVRLAIDTVTAIDTVKSIDAAKRTLTLESPNGRTETYKVSGDVINFDQIHVGDKVRATLADALAVSIRKPGISPNVGDAVVVALAPKGAKPGMFIANTAEATSKIAAIDPANRTITLEGAGGSPKTVRLAPGLNVSDFKKGDDVVVRYTEALALYVQKR